MTTGAYADFAVFSSERASIGIYTSNEGNNNYTLKWAYSASGEDANPYALNLTYAEPDRPPVQGLEHRIDWLGPRQLEFRNSGSNSSANFKEYTKPEDSFNLPTTPAPFSYKAWANGEPTDSAGPPQVQPAVTRVLYARFFFNSSLPERQAAFASQCGRPQARLGDAGVCSTDDLALRNSTQFSLAALNDYVPPSIPFHPPIYGWVPLTVAGGIAVLLIAHALVRRKLEDRNESMIASLSGSTLVSNGSADKSFSLPEEKHKRSPSDETYEYLAEEIVVARSGSYLHGFGDDSSSIGHGSPLKSRAFPGRRESSGQMSSRPPSFNELSSRTPTLVGSRPGSMASKRRFSSRGSMLSRKNIRTMNVSDPETRDITDLDQLFDGWETASAESDDDEEPEQVDGNLDRYNDWDTSSIEKDDLPMHKDDVDAIAMAPTINFAEHAFSPHPELGPHSQIVRWNIRDQGTQVDAVGQLAEPASDAAAAAIARDHNNKSALGKSPSLLKSLLKRTDDFFFVAQTTQVTSTGQKRIDYLDGMRGYACLFVSMSHFLLIFYPGISNPQAPHHYPGLEFWFRALIGPITQNAGLLLGTFFALPARTMCQRYLLKGGIGGLADATVRRIPRLMVPVAGAALANYFLMDVDAFKWVPRINSITWSVWSYWQNYPNVLAFVNAVITLPWAGPPAEPALVTGYATGVLWTIPVIIQGMWTAMIASVIAHEFKNHYKRFAFYAAAVSLSWYANTWDMYFLSGLIVGDLDSKLRYREWAARGIPIFKLPGKKALRVHGKWLFGLFLAACCVQQWLADISGSPGANVTFADYGMHPDWVTAKPHAWAGVTGWSGYTNPTVFGWFFIMSIFMAVDMFPLFQKFFRLRIWHFLGIHSMGIYLLHGIIWWTWACWLCITLFTAGVPYWACVLVACATGYMLLILFVICFTNTFEGKLVSPFPCTQCSC